MKFFPDVTPEDDYVTADGFDWRDLNKYLHEDVWYPDHKIVLETRNPFLAGYWEMAMLRMRTYNYLLALTHMLNTGDGVVLERSAWSGTVFARTLKDVNLVSQDYLDHYWDIRSAAFSRMHRPHVVIYLDVPVDKCLENARKNVSTPGKLIAIDWRQSLTPSPLFRFVLQNTHGAGELLDEEYLEAIERNYKKYFLKIIGTHAELFTYKLNEPVTEANAAEISELIVDELGKSDMDENFMRVTSGEEKFEDWRFYDSDLRFTDLRHKVTNQKEDVLQFYEFYPYYVDELWPAYQLIYARDHVTREALEKHEKKLAEQFSLREKMFGKKLSFEERDSENWFVKNGYPPDYFQAEK